MERIDRLASVANRVKTPLALAGLVVVVLYGIFHQILSLDVFAKLESEPTFKLLSSALEKVFWLAMIALVLGVASYSLPLILRRERRAAKVSLVDASLDSKDSPYAQTIEGGVKTISPAAKQPKKGERL